MGLLQQRRVEIQAKELAAWLHKQGDNVYWTVDGDPLLAGRLSFPCPGDELASRLCKIGQPLLVLEPTEASHPSGVDMSAHQLDELVEREELGTRVLQLQWKGSELNWLLIEDEETSESMARNA